MKKKMRIVHKWILNRYDPIRNEMVGYNYLCNWAVGANYLKTDITNNRVSCQNCKRIIKKFKAGHQHKKIENIKQIMEVKSI